MPNNSLDPIVAALQPIESIEQAASLTERPFSRQLLANLTQIEPAIISGWLKFMTDDWPLEGFPEWFALKLDELGFIGNHDTPLSVSRFVASLFRNHAYKSVLDPACGTGGLLSAVSEQVGTHAALYGQEINAEAWAWACLRMLVGGQNNAQLQLGRGLIEQSFEREGFRRNYDLVLTNPPFGMHIDYEAISRSALFSEIQPEGMAPRLSSETAFVQQAFNSLSSDGIAAIIVPNGFLFRGGIDRKLRENLAARDAVKAVIGMPARLFVPGTTIETAILILSRNKTDSERGQILFIDARGLGQRDGSRIELDAKAAGKIQSTYEHWTAEDGFSEIIAVEKLDSDNFSFSPAHYINPAPRTELIDAGFRHTRMLELDQRYAILKEEYETLRSKLRETN
ncbi:MULTISPECIES: HsdM family class I SAM-dependent methyltransferase [Rhizobium]|uniref:HsdM family class I SAM-dependent methyltransferase n=1 Tax=Rhizobium TaxID=379 RepID=UPI0015DA8A4A|nr:MULTISPECIES: N-6 DNA methylase [Rhizobium]MDV4155037.1 N-6 DNA methylase [Rhizobium brockwellii]NZD51400.1 N-6 DNA methylase [Rhizobium leguminosarum]